MPRLKKKTKRGAYNRRGQDLPSCSEVEGTEYGHTIKKRGVDVPYLQDYMQLHDKHPDAFTSTSDLHQDWKRLVDPGFCDTTAIVT